jgi:hypothetical protein
MSRRTPRDLGMLVALPRLEDDRVGTAHDDAMARLQHMVVGIAAASEPHAAVRDDEFTGPAMERHRMAPVHEQRGVGRIRLRLHHESPGCRRVCRIASSL